MTRRVAYVLLAPPRHSETFIRREVLALREHGIPSRVFCLRDDAQGEVPSEVAAVTEILADQKMRMDLPLWAVHWAMEHHPAELRGWLGASLPERADDAKRHRRALWRLGCALHIAAACDEHGVDHLHCHYANAPARVGLMVKRLTGIPCSFTGHAKDIFTMERERLAKTVREADFAVSCSERGADLMREAAPESATKIHRIYHGIDAREWRIDRSPRETPPLLLAVGRLTPKKGFLTLVEAIGLLRDERVPVELEIIGEGREEEALLRQIADLRVSDLVTLAGRRDQGEIRMRLAEATALVHPSIILESGNQDGLANVVLEAMAAGVPVIVSDVPALREAVTDGETGLIFPSGDAKALAGRIRELLADSGLQRRLGEAGRQRVAAFDTEEATRALVRLFSENG